jgi:hypothetical protein
MSDEDEITVSNEDCKRWAADINARLDAIRTKDGEDAYRLMFLTAFLLQNFADQLEADVVNVGRGEN